MVIEDPHGFINTAVGYLNRGETPDAQASALLAIAAAVNQLTEAVESHGA